jgi:hypothetical protein
MQIKNLKTFLKCTNTQLAFYLLCSCELKKYLPVQFHRQVQFSQTIKANGHLREFNFLKIKNAEFPTYHVDVSDERGNRHYFSLVFQNDLWEIAETKLPQWIKDAQDVLGSAVSAYEVLP